MWNVIPRNWLGNARVSRSTVPEIVLVGVGAISEELALRCKAFKMTVLGVSASRHEAAGFDRIYLREDLLTAAAQGDFLVVLVPYEPSTHHLIDRRVLDAMPAHARLLNIARGPVIDEAALIAALRDKRIAGAGLDVFCTEPLPPDSPLWTLPNVIITPRIGGMSDSYAEQVLPLLMANVRAYAARNHNAMRNIVHLSSRS